MFVSGRSFPELRLLRDFAMKSFVASPPVPRFDAEDDRWKCCCDTTHVTTGAYIICGIDIVLSISAIVYFAVATPVVGGIVDASIIIVAAGLTIAGLALGRPLLLMPNIIVKVFREIGFFFAAVLAIIALTTGKMPLSSNEGDVQQAATIMLSVSQIGLLMNGWFFFVLLRALDFLNVVASFPKTEYV